MTQAEILDLSEQFIEEVALAMNGGGDNDEDGQDGGSIVEGDGGAK